MRRTKKVYEENRAKIYINFTLKAGGFRSAQRGGMVFLVIIEKHISKNTHKCILLLIKDNIMDQI